jgi:hypothetical protein
MVTASKHTHANSLRNGRLGKRSTPSSRAAFSAAAGLGCYTCPNLAHQ